MNALELPGLTARIDAGLLIELSGEDQLCGKGLLFAVIWSRSVNKLDAANQERPSLTRGVSPYLLEMQKREADLRRHSR